MTKNAPSPVTIYGFPRSWGLPNMSPYCMKVEVFMRLAKVPHERKVGDLRRAPRGQMPYALIDGAIVGDSDAIIDRVAERFAVDLDAGRSADECAKDRALSRMLEESTVWVLRYGRFVDDGYDDLRHFMDAILPAGLSVILRPMIRRDMKRALLAQGMGRYSRDEIYAFGRRDLDAVEGALGDQPFIGGERPCRADATMFSFVGNFLCEHARSPMTDYAGSKRNLVSYAERMRELVYPELPSWIGRKVGAPLDEPQAHAA